MSLAVDLGGIGLPMELATRLGLSTLTSITTAGTAQGTATLIPNMVNNVLLVTASSQTGAILPSTAELGMPYYVQNSTSTTGVVYPPTSGFINAGSVNVGVNLAQNEAAVFWRRSSTRWQAFFTAQPNITGQTNTWSASQTFSDRAFFRGAGPALTQTQGAPTAKTVTSAITAAELLTGIITTTGATGPSIHQLPTGTLLSAAISGVTTGDSFDWSLINTGTGASDDATITVNTDHTIIGNPTAGALTDATIISGSARFRSRCSAANTWITYRIA